MGAGVQHLEKPAELGIVTGAIHDACGHAYGVNQPSSLQTASPANGQQQSRVDALGFSVLLDDPEIALWANETGLRYLRYWVSCVEAVGVLAQALVVAIPTMTQPDRRFEGMG